MLNKKCIAKFLFFVCFCLITVFAYSENFHITEVEYKIDGQTRKSVLEEKIPIDKSTIFSDEEEFNQYLAKLEQKFVNARTIDSFDIQVIPLQTVNNVTDIKLFIYSKDSWNFVAVPFPTYDSNTGLKLKIKLKDMNFLGRMEEFSSTFTYDYNLDDGENKFTFDFNFSTPFKLLKLPMVWTSEFDFSYVIGDNVPTMGTKQTLGFTIPFFSLNLNIAGTQYIGINGLLKGTEKFLDFGDTVSVSLPLTLGNALNSKIKWTPSISYTYDWHLKKDNDKYSIVKDSSYAKIESSFSSGSINWSKNFRNGYSVEFAQLFKYVFEEESLYETIDLTSIVYHKFNSNIAINSRQYAFVNLQGNTTQKGEILRGIRNASYNSACALLINVDLPIKAFQTNWRQAFNAIGLNWNWVSAFDFEFQFSPFFDMAIGHNPNPNTINFSLKDGYYGTGFEMLVFPTKMRSIQARASFGVDAVRFAQKLGTKSATINKITNKLFNTEWRNGSWWELFIGIGLFY